MAKKISQLTQATEVKSDDVTVIVQDGETKKLPLNMMVTKQDIENKKIAGLAKLDEIEATYENDTYTPTITVKNKSSVKTGEGDEVDYSANVMDGHAKSAILTGNTINNLWKGLSNSVVVQLPQEGTTIQSDYSEQYAKVILGEKQVNAATTVGMYTTQPLQESKTYYINTFVFDGNETDNFLIRDADNSINLETTVIKKYPTGQILSFKTQLSTSRILFYYFANTRKYGAVNYGKPFYMPKRFIISDKLEDVVNQEFFEGMQSVKMPVLTTTGKNLFNIEDNTHVLAKLENGNYKSIPFKNFNLPKFKEKTSYTLSFSVSKFYDESLQFPEIIYTDGTNLRSYRANQTFNGNPAYILTSDPNKTISHIAFSYGTNNITLEFVHFQIEEGSKSTTYEPYKSNILTANEPVELRGIGDARDTLDCLTGEVVQNIGEVVLDGSEEWIKWGSGFLLKGYLSNPMFVSGSTNDIRTSYVKCDRFPSTIYSDVYGGTSYGVGIYDRNVGISVNGISTLEAFKTNLSENPIKICYPVANKSIKTVDLMPSGTHPSTTPYCWKNGHIQLSSSGLLPNLEYSVVTSRAGQINQNAAMIVKNDKRIFDLEILLAGGLVNTTYQALTLQNQVETGLSKVSLNSEKEPDYLLYHMIMKLIEEKAYKLDDLTEKVSVFYLYEKLSDEQFETIYSALYPFVEDEIVEEPVVEELPEVVEDEVIM